MRYYAGVPWSYRLPEEKEENTMEHAVIEREEFFMAIEGGKTEGGNTAGKRYTVADIEALPEGERAELIDGEMFMMASPTLTHQDILVGLSSKIWNYIEEHKGKCKILPAPIAVYIKDDIHNYVEPDISVICDKEKLDEKGCHGAPDWVIEIVSPSSRHMDYVRKLSLYEEAGVREYWIVDPEQRNVTVHDLEHQEGPELHSFSERVKAGIYEDLFLDFGELE